MFLLLCSARHTLDPEFEIHVRKTATLLYVSALGNAGVVMPPMTTNCCFVVATAAAPAKRCSPAHGGLQEEDTPRTHGAQHADR